MDLFMGVMMISISNILNKIDKLLFNKFKTEYLDLLERETSDCQTILDVGCGANSAIRGLKIRPRVLVGVDGFEPSIAKSKAKNIHDKYLLIDIKDLDKHIDNKSFDCVYISDVIEHFNKSDGLKLLETLENIAIKKIIVFTPNGFLEQKIYDGNFYQLHLSGWDYQEMSTLGYSVYGCNGLKFLRGEYGHIKFWPKILWSRIALVSQAVTRIFPKYSFAIFCIKTLK